MIENFHPPIQNNRQSTRGGGTAIYVKNTINITEVKINLFKEKEIETTSTIIHVDKQNILLTSVYFGFLNQSESISDLKVHLMNLIRQYKCKQIFLMGDYNINLLNHAISVSYTHLTLPTIA